MGNYDLLTSDENFLIKLKNEFQDKKNMGNTVVTTLDADLQEAAYQALGDKKGAVVAMEPKTDPCHGIQAGFRSEYSGRELEQLKFRYEQCAAESCDAGTVCTGINI